MRKLLLATVAGLGTWGAVAVDANAQTAAPTYSNGSVTSYNGGVALPTVGAPTPGSVVVRLNGRIRFYAYEASDRDANTSTNKLNSYGFAEYGRLYPGFDGIAANGLKYGANLEIRQDAGGPAGGGTAGSISGQNNVRSKLYFRRVWGYLGTDSLGTIRLGSTDQPTSLYMTGNYENFNDGGSNGDVPFFAAASINVGFAWPFADIGSYYTTSKIVYLSPALFGFDFGVSYEPTTANTSGSGNCFAAAPGCDNLSSTTTNAETARRRNTFDMLVRYRGSFGPVGLAATAAYVTGSHIQDNSGLGFTNSPLATGGARYNYDGLSVGDFGAAVTVAGFSVGGHYMTGRWNGYIGGLVPKGLPDGHAWILGTSYTFGPAIVGAQYFVAEEAGDLSNAFYGRLQRNQALAVGGTYSLAPGVSLYLSGLLGERRQNGFNFLTGAGVTAATGPAGQAASNKVTSSVVSIGTAFSW